MTGSILGAIALGLFLWLANGIRLIGAVSQGRKAGDRPGTALLLIDLQAVFWEQGPYEGKEKADAESAILDEIAAAKAKGYPVIAIRQEWSFPSTKVIAYLAMKGQAVEGTPGVEIAAPFAGLADHELVKPVQDGFETGELDALLERLDIGKCRIAGLDFNHCVAKTALAARNRGFDVAVATRATLSAGPRKKTQDMLTAHSISLQ
jgi:nicotinamidase-related amidase